MADKKSMQEIEKMRQNMILGHAGRRFTNMLDEIVDQQKRFASKFIPLDNMTDKEKTDWTKELIIAIIDELSEVLGWLPFKHWKDYSLHKVDELEVKYELIDLLHFVIEIMLVWGMTAEDIFTMYQAKMWENHRRQNEGY